MGKPNTSLFSLKEADQLRKLLSGHLCRCTGYENIFKAVKKTMLRRLGRLDDPYLNIGDEVLS